MKNTRKIGIIGAMQEEIDYLLAHLEGTTEQEGFFCGQLFHKDVILVRSGIGKVNAAMTAQKLISEYHITDLVNTGIAGAMGKGISVLDFVVAEDTVQHDVDCGFGASRMEIARMDCSYFPADRNWIAHAQKTREKLQTSQLFSSSVLYVGRIATGDQFIEDPIQKKEILELCHPACVDMESAALGQVCYVNHIPFCILRCMSDSADDNQQYLFQGKIAAKMSATFVEEMIASLEE